MPAERLRWRQVRATTAFRLTLLLGMLFLAGLWATLAASYVLTARELTARSDRILLSRADTLLHVPAALLPGRVSSEIADATAGISFFALVGQDDEPVTGNIALAAGAPIGRPFSVDAMPSRHGPLRVLAVRTSTGEKLIVGRDVSQIRDLRRRMLQILIGSGAGGSALLLGAAVALSVAPLRRVRDLTRASRAIAAGDFATRMPIAGRHDELDQFAATVNQMVEEVAHVVGQVKSATDAVAHDLRTPLTRARATLARLSTEGDLAPPAAEIVDRSLGDLDAVIARFAALLRLAELEASGRRAGMWPLAPEQLLAEVTGLWEPVAEERGVTLALETVPVPTFRADRELMIEALGNLVDNAIKFARSAVTVGAAVQDGEVVLWVTDDGPGVPADERDAVLRRFHRASGAAGVQGTGLGLALVSAIARLHGFTLELTDAAPGLTARLRCPPHVK